MDSATKSPTTSLFQVYLRLRPPPSPLVQLTPQSLYPSLPPPERYLTVEPPVPETPDGIPTHITIRPPSDSRKRAVEKFAFTKVFQEKAAQLDIFKGTGVIPLVEGVLGESRDGLLATLGVTGSPSLVSSLNAADVSEAQILPARDFLDGVYGDALLERTRSRAPTPMTVGRESHSNLKPSHVSGPQRQWSILNLSPRSSCRSPTRGLSAAKVPINEPKDCAEQSGNDAHVMPSRLPFWNTPRVTRNQAKVHFGNTPQDPYFVPSVPKRHLPQRPSALPHFPDITDMSVPTDANSEYAVVVSMYEVYNDRIFDLLSHPRNLKDLRRRPLLFKPTEASPDRKVVAGLRKIVCGTYDEALMVLETGLMERRVAGTGSNSRAIMIVTADPLGDFNATSQILRYSALAREVTVPRMPSVSSTIIAGSIGCSGTHKPDANGRTSPSATHTDETVVDMAFSEIARLSEEVELLGVKLSEEGDRRQEAEEAWQKAEERAEEIEREVREECWEDMEGKLAEERKRWIGAWGEEADRNGEHLDRKLDIFTKGIRIYEDPADSSERVIELEAENERLRRQLDSLEREINSRSPSRISKQPQQLTTSNPRKKLGDAADDFGMTLFKLSAMNSSPKEPKSSPVGKTPGKRIRKLTTRKWDLMDEDELDSYELA
ncbi:MAG: hypothetical protein Q9208_003053 [Pyrenodesmia sp. 3 TL-2023]